MTAKAGEEQMLLSWFGLEWQSWQNTSKITGWLLKNCLIDSAYSTYEKVCCFSHVNGGTRSLLKSSESSLLFGGDVSSKQLGLLLGLYSRKSLMNLLCRECLLLSGDTKASDRAGCLLSPEGSL